MVLHFVGLLLFTFSSLFRGGEKAEILFAGDAMQHKAQIEAADKGRGVFDYSECFSSVAPLVEAADYAVVNLETPLAGAPYTGYPCFSAPDAYLDALSEAGFDMMLTANNHTLDKRDRGMVRTLDCLDSRQLDHIGTYRNAAERDSVLPFIKSVNGFDVAFLNYTYGTNGFSLVTEAVVDYIDRDLIARDIAKAREAGAEIVAVCIHWGVEYELLPAKSQKSLADFIVGAGADMVIGGHPHVIQPMELRVAPDGRKSLVVYSLGNFISNMKTRDTRGGAILNVTLERDPHGVARVADASYRLLFTLPADATRNFRLILVEECQSGAWSDKCRQFEQSAEAIFSKHNVGVSRDSSRVEKKKSSPLEIFLQKTLGGLKEK